MIYRTPNGGDQRLATEGPAMPLDLIAGPLHRVVLGEPSIRTGHPLPDSLMLPGRRGRTPTRIARLLTRPRQLTRAMSDSHRAATPTRLPTGTSTQLQLLSGLNPGSPHRCQPRPAIMPPSLSHLQQSRDCPIAKERRWISFFRAKTRRTSGITGPRKTTLVKKLVARGSVWNAWLCIFSRPH